jgi:hypothetical protein
MDYGHIWCGLAWLESGSPLCDKDCGECDAQEEVQSMQGDIPAAEADAICVQSELRFDADKAEGRKKAQR